MNAAQMLMQAVIHQLHDSVGFSDWWYSIDAETREEIEESVTERAHNTIQRAKEQKLL